MRLGLTELRAILLRRPYQGTYWWMYAPNVILRQTEDGMSDCYSYRGFFVRRTNDLFRPYLMYLRDASWCLLNLFEVCSPTCPRKHTAEHHNSILSDTAVDAWIQCAAQARARCESVDGLPWPLHAICNHTARVTAIETYLDAH